MPISSYKDMQKKKSEIIGILRELARIVDTLEKMGLAIDGEALLALKKRIENDNFKVLVIGEFKNGKSTFINALMGENILPTHSTPCTAVINEVMYDKEKSALIFFKDPLPEEITTDIRPEALQHIKKYGGHKVPPMELDIDVLADYVVIQDPLKNQADSIKELPYSKVVLKYPIQFCRDGIEIIDSPGLNENGVRTKVTEEYICNADAIIFVFRCPQIAGQSEMAYIKNQIQPAGYNDIFFICNAIDQVPENERDKFKKLYNQKLAELTSLKESGIFYVNALGALNAKESKDKDSLELTGMPEFEKALSEYLNNNRGKTKLIQVINPINNYIGILKSQRIKSYKELLNQSIEDLNNKIEKAKPNLEAAEKKKEEVIKKLSSKRTELEEKIEKLINIQYGAVIKKIPKEVDEMDIDNHMTANPFKQKSSKEALENEVITKLEIFVQKEMNMWINVDLNKTIDDFINELQKDIGNDIDIFYENLDQFRYDISGIDKPKNISGFERVSAAALGLIAGGPTYSVLGASLGLGEIAKRSAIMLALSFAVGAILPAPMLAAYIIVIGSGLLQLVTGGKTLTKKYKEKLKKGIIESMEGSMEENCKEYAHNITNSVMNNFDVITETFEKEVQTVRSTIDSLSTDKEGKESEIENKRIQLTAFEQDLDNIIETLNDLSNSIE